MDGLTGDAERLGQAAGRRTARGKEPEDVSVVDSGRRAPLSFVDLTLVADSGVKTVNSTSCGVARRVHPPTRYGTAVSIGGTDRPRPIWPKMF